MKKWLTMAMVLMLCLGLCACGTTSETGGGNVTPTTQTPVDLPDGATLDANGNIVIDLTYDNWSEYFYFSAHAEPSAWADGDVLADFAAFPMICIKEEYRSRTVTCQFDIEMKQENLTAYTTTYNTVTKESVTAPCTEAEWEAFNVGLPHTEEWGGQEKVYTFLSENIAAGLVMYDDPEPTQFFRSTISEDGTVYTIPYRVPGQFFIRSVMGSITLSQ